MDQTIILIATGAIIAGFVQGLSGFAFSMVAMSIWAWVLEPQLAALLSTFGALLSQIIGAISVRRGYDFRLLLPFLAGGLAGIPIGVVILPNIDMDVFKAILGLLFLIWCPVMLLAQDFKPEKFGSKYLDALVGMTGGVMSGIAGLSGVVPSLWCSFKRWDKDTQRSVIQNFNLTMLMVTMITYLAAGMADWTMWPEFSIVAVAVLVPTLLGTRLYAGISENGFRRVILGMLTLSGALLLTGSLPQLFQRM